MMDCRQNRIQSFAFVISAFAALCFAFYFAPNLVHSASHADAARVDKQINPNTAEIESLVRLPDIGFARAEAIIEYRNSFTQNNIGRRAFETPDDLQNIHGIGPKTVQNMRELLRFE
ncbi:MAG: helix-hairpin-helix domain-containing protein [Sedimentisphaerales bacterium]|nr:helix-hairpin-helix domain-containing protein [Sedimentisphaerales bacterium]